MPTVLITGASTGIGRVTAEVLAQRGWHVFATMRDVQKREKLEAALKTAGVQDRVEIVALDLTDAASIEAAVPLVLSRTGGTLDAVVHNAGVSAAGAFEDLPSFEIRRVMETNFFGVLELTRVLLPVFRAKRDGRIILVSSEAAFMGQPANSIYCASKGGVVQLTRALALELAPQGVRCNAICPCDVETPMLAGQAAVYGRGDPEGYRQKLRAIYPQGEHTRFVQPEEVAEFVFAVAGLEPITGACLPIDFGTTAGR